MTSKHNSSTSRIALFFLCTLLVFLAACNHGSSQGNSATPSIKHYAFKGKVVSIDQQAGMANIDNEPIAGFMDPMVMPYTVKPAPVLTQLLPGDTVTGDLLVRPDNSYWLENLKVRAHSSPKPPATPAGNR